MDWQAKAARDTADGGWGVGYIVAPLSPDAVGKPGSWAAAVVHRRIIVHTERHASREAARAACESWDVQIGITMAQVPMFANCAPAIDEAIKRIASSAATTSRSIEPERDAKQMALPLTDGAQQ